MNEVPQSAPPRTERRRPHWVPMGLALCVWLCTLPFVVLLIGPRFGARVAVFTALTLLVVIAVACRALGAGSRMPRDAPRGEAKR